MSNIAASVSRVVPMTKWICRWKPFWIPIRFKRPDRESKNNHRSYSASRTAASESLQVSKDDGWSAAREIPAPSGSPSLPQSSWQPFGATNAPIKLWKIAETQESTVIVEPLSTSVSSKTRVRDFTHAVQFGIFPKRLPLTVIHLG